MIIISTIKTQTVKWLRFMESTPLILLFLGGVILTIGDIVMKKWVLANDLGAFWLGLFIYLTAMIFLAHSFKYKNMAVASTILVIFNVVTLAAVSYLVFGEKLVWTQTFGIAIGIAAVAMLELSEA
ncbi:hypothetical protein HUU62_15720 [Rhodoferax sp. 4810]|uniref:EamA domain-containing protein n=1 Tax=Thiospirillum jenense TaxID=1653858 RepID=A0A839HIR0_9GAMM|nr:hypothetical protein [Thiospirillum jenense]MBB1075851.1 hypothetical protein [Rhodoferax jenense]MBB1126926.1 hypothetical protein [Thiospirillum jenense]